jgi:putative transposase
MPRSKRITLGGYVYHVLNRANGRLRIFRKDGDFLAFEQILAEGIERYSMRLCGYCIMSNHWHLLVWPVSDGDLPQFMRLFVMGWRHRLN